MMLTYLKNKADNDKVERARLQSYGKISRWFEAYTYKVFVIIIVVIIAVELVPLL